MMVVCWKRKRLIFRVISISGLLSVVYFNRLIHRLVVRRTPSVLTIIRIHNQYGGGIVFKEYLYTYDGCMDQREMEQAEWPLGPQ